MILFCVRHGQSEFNAEGRIQGQFDAKLSELGRSQAHRVAEALAVHPVEKVFTSPLSRAYQTAQVIAERLELPLEVIDDLQELNAGVFQGKLWSEVEAEYPEASKAWRSYDPDFKIPQGESRRELMIRGTAALEAIREKEHECVVAVSHGAILGAGIKGLLQIPAELNPFQLANCSITQLKFGERFKLISLNETGHLQSVEVQRSAERAHPPGW